MQIVFIGTVDFSRHCLMQVIKNGGKVKAVLTLDRKNAGFHSDYSDLSEITSRHKIPLHSIQNINHPDTVDLVRSLKPDVLFFFGWSQLVSKKVLEIPVKGCIGSHPALLPKNRGRHPLIWVLIEGLKEISK